MSYAIIFALNKKKVAELSEKYHIPTEWSEVAKEFDSWFALFEKYPLEQEWCGFYVTHDYVSSSDGMVMIQTLITNIEWLSEVALELCFLSVETDDDINRVLTRLKNALAEVD